MRHLKQEIYFPIIVLIHLGFWAIDLVNYQGGFLEVDADTMLFGRVNGAWANPHRVIGEIFSSWVVTVFAFNFLMATRAKWVERIFGGLDKMYLIHRRSGIIAIALLTAHFIVVPRASEFNPGKPLGFYAFVLIIIGVILSASPLFKRKIPYHKWLNFHKLMGVFYVLGVVHGLMVDSLIKELPITRIYVFGMSFIGIIAWVYRAFLFNLFNKKLSYKVESVSKLSSDVREIILVPLEKRLNYLAGQFAFFTFPSLSNREQHPFTLSSHPFEDNLRVTIKSLGDYTHNLNDNIQPGDKATVEGPYGHFSASYIKEKEQVWIAGGIGITPFLSLARDMYFNQVTLFWCVGNESEAVYKEELDVIAKENSKFSYVIWPSDNKGHLSLHKMNIEKAGSKGYLICGPDPLKKSITTQLKAAGVKQSAVYYEEFAFR